jgi:ATP-binding cassette subfamily C protein
VVKGLAYGRGDAPILRGVDLDLAPGAFVGLAGDSGAGKSTLADLMVGLLTPTAGDILLGDQPLTNDRLATWRDRLAYVSQDPFLFHDTIRANLLWGAAAGAQEADLWQALARTGAEAMVRGLPGGLDTVVGERGLLVSGGERQRLALARALLRRPDLLILDEATNAIDLAAEADILAALRALEPRPTILLIAHRRESFQACDAVLRLEAGVLRHEPLPAPARA